MLKLALIEHEIRLELAFFGYPWIEDQKSLKLEAEVVARQQGVLELVAQAQDRGYHHLAIL